MAEVTTNQVKEMIDQLAAMTAAASITPEIVASIFEKMRNLNDQEREKVIKVATEYIEEIKNTGITAEKVHLNSGSNAEEEISAILTEVFPLKVSVPYSNDKSYEVGTSVIPEVNLAITRRGNNVSSSAIVTCSSPTASIDPDTKKVTDNSINSGSKTFSISVQQGGQTVSAGSFTWQFLNYVYSGSVTSKPTSSNIVSVIKSLSKSLSSATKKGATDLAANTYYVFAVKGSVNLVCHNASSGGTISGCTTGTVTLTQENNPSLTNVYSYIIVEKSSNAWKFTIENS